MNFLPRDPVLRWGLAVSAGWTALCVIVTAIPEAPQQASSAAPPVPPATAPIGGWLPLGASIALRRGVRYRGCIKLPWFAPHFSASTVRARAETEGFRDVIVVDRPSEECEYMVEATWDREARMMQRPSVVVAAWEER